MASQFNILNYLAGLTGYTLDSSVYERIAMERGVTYVTSFYELTEQQKDLCLADILLSVYLAPSGLPSMQVQHGQFSQSVGKQDLGNKEGIYRLMMRLYSKWGDPKADMYEESNLQWME